MPPDASRKIVANDSISSANWFQQSPVATNQGGLEFFLPTREEFSWAGSRCHRYRRDSELVGKAAAQNLATAGLE